MSKLIIIDQCPRKQKWISVLFQTNQLADSVFAFEDLTRCVGNLKKIRPDYLVLGETAEEYNLFTLLHLKKSQPHCKLIALIDHMDVSGSKFFLRSGVHALVEKDSPAKDWNLCLQDLKQHGSHIPTEIANQLHKEMELSWITDLTTKEYHVLLGLAKGNTYQQLCADLHITRGTLTSHIFRLYRKLGVKNKAEAIHRVSQQSLPLPMLEDSSKLMTVRN